VPTVSELRAEADATSAGSGAGGTAQESGGGVPCYGDGVSGKRVQVIYAVAADRPDRYAAVVDLIRGYAVYADQAFLNSAARDGGVRHVRWVTDSACRLAVERVVMSPLGDDSLANTRTELRTLGYTNPDRKYLVFADAGVYCGISYTAGDARPDATNPANNGGTWSRVDSGCWGGTTSVPAHEIAHMLGAVQIQAPNSNGAWHCTDEYDRLCYNDGAGSPVTYLCATSQEPLLDCNGDDYFNVAPAPGSWLATHWNLVNSVYLESAGPTSTPTPTPTPTATSSPSPTVTSSPSPSPSVTATVTSSPTPSTTTTQPTAGPAPTTTTATPTNPTSSPTTASPTPTLTTSPEPSPTATRTKRKKSTVWKDRLTKRRNVRVYTVRAEGGSFRTGLRFVRAKALKVVVRERGGEVVYSAKGRSVLVRKKAVDPGRFRVVVRGKAGAKFRLRVTRLTY
jgi:hypothetical protein